MLSKLSILSLALALVQGLALPVDEKVDLAARSAPSPLKLDFDVLTTVGNLTAKEYWSKVSHLTHKNSKRAYPETITDYKDISYNLDVFLGSNQQKVLVSLDTGSSDLWVVDSNSGDGYYDPLTSSTAQDTGEEFEIGYEDQSTSQGEYYLDTLKFSTSNPVLLNFQFASVSQSSTGISGILGVGDKNTEAASTEYNNLPWALQAAGITPKASYSLFLGSEQEKKGSIIFGGIDTEKYSGELTKYSIDTANGAGLAVNVPSIDINGKTIEVNQPFVLDSGTSLGLVPKDVQNYLDSQFEHTLYTEGSITYRMVSCDQPTDKFITFNFGLNTVKLSYADAISNDDGTCMLGFTYYQDNVFILGDVFLRSAYVYYDLTDQSISLAQAQYLSSSNIISA